MVLNEKLPREYIEDTLVAKRAGIFKEKGLIPDICAYNLRILRKSALAPHTESKMLAGRYAAMYEQKKTASEMIVVLRGGVIEEILSTNPFTKIHIADYDLNAPSDEELEARESAEERANNTDMHIVYII